MRDIRSMSVNEIEDIRDAGDDCEMKRNAGLSAHSWTASEELEEVREWHIGGCCGCYQSSMSM